MQKINLTIKETQGEGKAAKRVEVGKVDIFVPTVAELLPILAAAKQAQATDENTGKPLTNPDGSPVLAVDDDGYPIYEPDTANWIVGACIAAAKAQARSRLVKGTANLKEGQKISQTLEELATAGERSGSVALANMREAREAFAKWVASQGKSAATQEMLVKLFKNREALSMQSADTKKKMQGYVEAFAEAVSSDEVALEKYTRTIETLLEVCGGDEMQTADDF